MDFRRPSWSLMMGFLFGLSALGLVEPGTPANAEDQAAKPTPATTKEKKLARSSIVISRETTVIDGPVLENGDIDYIAALNQQLSHGVTPENNAAVLMLQITGPREVGSSTPEYCRMLGVLDYRGLPV